MALVCGSQACMGLDALDDDADDLDATSRDAVVTDGSREDAWDAQPDAAPASGITAFDLTHEDNAALSSTVHGTIHGDHIAVTVPHGTHVTALKPSITFTGVRVEPASGEAQDFTHAVEYTVIDDNGGRQTYTAAVTVGPDCSPPPVTTCSHAEYDRAHAYARANPTHNGGTWNQWCAALTYRFSNESHAAQPSAIAAYHASHIVSTDYHTARIGAVHYWSIGIYGHVGVDLLGGGTDVFMASNHITTVWGTSIGTNSVPGYSSSAGARYLGWSMDYAGSTIPGGGDAACTPTASALPAGCPLPRTATQTSGTPDTDFWRLMQAYAATHGYTGPVNGVMGPNSWEGVQRAMQSYGYTGPVNGIPGVNTYAAMQRLAAMYGYTGPVNGVLGANSYKGLATFLNAHFAG